MSVGARGFVAVIFTILAVSFVATTAVLYFEYGLDGGTDWTAIATYYSHLFIFFPTFGILALIAFFVPACILVDMYWDHVPNGKARFMIGFMVAVLLALIGGNVLGTGGVLKSIFEIKPEVLIKDAGEPADCAATGKSACQRAPVLNALREVRNQSTRRAGMSKFVRDCSPDPLIGNHPQRQTLKYCFVTQSLAEAETCCKAQERFGTALYQMYQKEENLSLTGTVHRYLLPLKVFFLLMVFALAMLLALRHQNMEKHYKPFLPKIQRGLLVGAAAMLVWPLMNLAFLQSSGLLYGTGYESIYRDISPLILGAFVAWALLLVFFFFKSVDRADKDMENMGRITSLGGSALALMNYQTIVDYSVRFAGAGATVVSLGGLFLVVLVAFFFVVLQPKRTASGGLSLNK
ncbi:MAG: hypothetical protein K0U74_09085 [Alphaproteobacteria bacterium]|nr:hypothetical protein [Alphaproteobacteria bacterium]